MLAVMVIWDEVAAMRIPDWQFVVTVTASTLAAKSAREEHAVGAETLHDAWASHLDVVLAA